MKLNMLAALLLLAGCAGTHHVYYTDGERAELVVCPTYLGPQVCYDKAMDLCPGGYTVLEKPKNVFFTSQSITIRCNEPKKK